MGCPLEQGFPLFIISDIRITVRVRAFWYKRASDFLARPFRKDLIPKEIGGMVLPSNLVHPLVPDDFLMVLMDFLVLLMDYPLFVYRFSSSLCILGCFKESTRHLPMCSPVSLNIV